MEISKFITDNGTTIFRVSGKLIYSSIDKLKTGIDSVIEEGVSKIIVNLKDTNIVDSASVGLLVSRSKVAEKRDGFLCFCELQPAIAKLFTMVGANQRLDIFNTERQALEYTRTDAQTPPGVSENQLK